jgi:hypothetical protein
VDSLREGFRAHDTATVFDWYIEKTVSVAAGWESTAHRTAENDDEEDAMANAKKKVLYRVSENVMQKIDQLGIEGAVASRQEVADAVRLVRRVMNDSTLRELFLQAFALEHRTHQQTFAGLCLGGLYRIADNGTDMRNEAAVKAANTVREALGDYGDQLPYV